MPVSLQVHSLFLRCWAEVTTGVPSPDKDKADGSINPLSTDSSRNSSLKSPKRREKGCFQKEHSFQAAATERLPLSFLWVRPLLLSPLTFSPCALAVAPSGECCWTEVAIVGKRSPQKCRHRENPQIGSHSKWRKLAQFSSVLPICCRTKSPRQWTTEQSVAYKKMVLELERIVSSNPA